MPRRTRSRKNARRGKSNQSSYKPETEEIDDIDAEFSVAAIDEEGDSTKSIFRHPDRWNRMIQEIISSGKWPYKTKSDFIRHGIHRHLRWLAVQEPGVTCWSMDELLNTVVGTDISNARMSQTMDKVRDQVNMARARGHDGDAIRLLQLSQQTIANMPGTQLRDSYMERFNEEWGPMLKAARQPMMLGGKTEGKGKKKKKNMRRRRKGSQ